MMKLLVPVDSSDNALRAVKHAIQMARDCGEVELVIVNAHEPPLVYGEIAVYLPEEKARLMQKQHSEDILKPAIEMAKSAGLRFTTEILVGNVPHAITTYAEASGCDGIVMGSRGMSAIGNLVMGSVATKVIHLTKLPVTLVK
jgi:nucleotide-binding universal stress UspA family protein